MAYRVPRGFLFLGKTRFLFHKPIHSIDLNTLDISSALWYNGSTLERGDMIQIVPFDQQCLLCDVSKPVQVYKNLHKKCWSVRQGGSVVFRTTYLCLKNVRFYVSEDGRQRVIAEKSKNVHAWATGLLIHSSEIDANTRDGSGMDVKYNPYVYDSFVLSKSDQIKIEGAAYGDFMIDRLITSDCQVRVWGAIPKTGC